jgi:hypothetical protein
MFRPAKEMDMIRHDNVPTNFPTMTFLRALPFSDQHLGRVFVRENVAPISGAYCNEINRRFDPNARKAAQMFMHEQNVDANRRRQRAAANGSGYNKTAVVDRKI